MKVNVILIGPEEPQLRQVEHFLAMLNGVWMEQRVTRYPEKSELERVLQAGDIAVLFISTELPGQMNGVVQHALQTTPNIQIVLVDSTGDSKTLVNAMKLGVRECLSAPFTIEDLQGALERSMARRIAIPDPMSNSAKLYSFLPAKPGVGATTLAVQAALSVPGAQRSLLMDADLEAGMIQFLLQLHTPYSLVDVLERVQMLDEHMWPQLVTRVNNLDVLHAGDSGNDYRADLGRFQSFLSFARRQYNMIFVDLPSAVNRLSTEVMHQSKVVFLVTTPEVASLHMARIRWRQLQDLQLGSQVRLLVNRVEKKGGGISPEEIAKTVGAPVQATFPNEYAEVQRALIAGGRLAGTNPIGRQLEGFAGSLSDGPVIVEAPKKRRFLEMFALTK